MWKKLGERGKSGQRGEKVAEHHSQTAVMWDDLDVRRPDSTAQGEGRFDPWSPLPLDEEKEESSSRTQDPCIECPESPPETTSQEPAAPETADQTATTEETRLVALADELGVPYLDPTGYTVDPQLLQLVPAEVAWRHRVVPLFALEGALTLATSDPRDVHILDEIRRLSGMEIDCVLSAPESIESALRRLYGEDRSQLLEELERLGEGSHEEGREAVSGGGSGADELGIADAPVVRMAQLLLTQAVRQAASDIHIEPARNELIVRLRIDGRLHLVPAPPKHIHAPLVSRLKVMAHMDIAEKRRPQDGRISLQVDGRDVDFRVSSLPTAHGENLVLRVLDRSTSLLTLEELGFSTEVVEGIRDLLERSYGIMLVTGPTGSGKTTSLYAALSTLNSVESNTVTLEDPIEREMKLVRQCQIDTRAGLTFAGGLRSILRQDPDIVMVGEIRDLETARIAMQAALTGHLVLSSLHTNDAPSALTRLIDMGVEPFLVASGVVGVLAQRLVRKLCVGCRRPAAVSPRLHRLLGEEADDGPFFESGGCEACRGWGYSGRTVLGELMVMGEELAELTVTRAPASSLRERALTAGMTSMRADGMAKARQGITSLEEVARATQV